MRFVPLRFCPWIFELPSQKCYQFVTECDILFLYMHKLDQKGGCGVKRVKCAALFLVICLLGGCSRNEHR